MNIYVYFNIPITVLFKGVEKLLNVFEKHHDDDVVTWRDVLPAGVDRQSTRQQGRLDGVAATTQYRAAQGVAVAGAALVLGAGADLQPARTVGTYFTWHAALAVC